MYQPGEYEDKLVVLAPDLFNGAEMGGETGMRSVFAMVDDIEGKLLVTGEKK